VTDAELLDGVELSSKKKANQAAVDALVRQLAVLQWPPDAARHCAEIRADLKKKGAMIGANDPMIAAHARSLAAVVVTNNSKDFGRINGLEVENWMS
jgi:tRNA(fMet)-specific endonuclease VapC